MKFLVAVVFYATAATWLGTYDVPPWTLVAVILLISLGGAIQFGGFDR